MENNNRTAFFHPLAAPQTIPTNAMLPVKIRRAAKFDTTLLITPCLLVLSTILLFVIARMLMLSKRVTTLEETKPVDDALVKSIVSALLKDTLRDLRKVVDEKSGATAPEAVVAAPVQLRGRELVMNELSKLYGNRASSMLFPLQPLQSPPPSVVEVLPEEEEVVHPENDDMPVVAVEAAAETLDEEEEEEVVVPVVEKKKTKKSPRVFKKKPTVE